MYAVLARLIHSVLKLCASKVVHYWVDMCMLSVRSDIASPACDHHSANPHAADPLYTISASPSTGQAFCNLQNTHVKCDQSEPSVNWPTIHTAAEREVTLLRSFMRLPYLQGRAKLIP
jgi:hypothetical protein